MKPKSEAKYLRSLLLIFAIFHALLVIIPALLGKQFSFMPLITQGDVLDLITPYILIPLYYLLLKAGSANFSDRHITMLFLLFAVIWVEGHGIHLAANSIARLAKELPGSEIALLSDFYDEKLSHLLWHVGFFGLSGVLIYQQWRNYLVKRSLLGIEVLGGIIHGLTCFIDAIESATVYLGLPLMLGVAIFGFWNRKYLLQQPILLFFWTAYLLASLLLIGWGIYWQGFPEFSQLGIID